MPEALHLGIYRRYDHQLGPTAIKIWESIGSTTYREQGHPGGDGGEGDSAGGPIPERETKDSWPTLVVEAGVSEPLGELHRDMQWWFSASDHQVKIVLLAKCERTRREIILEKWEEEPRARQGATTTRQAAALPTTALLQPTLRQSITITENAATDPTSYNVTRGALVLSFRLLFLRDPSPQEGDVVIDIPELEDYAKDVWALV